MVSLTASLEFTAEVSSILTIWHGDLSLTSSHRTLHNWGWSRRRLFRLAWGPGVLFTSCPDRSYLVDMAKPRSQETPERYKFYSDRFQRPTQQERYSGRLVRDGGTGYWKFDSERHEYHQRAVLLYLCIILESGRNSDGGKMQCFNFLACIDTQFRDDGMGKDHGTRAFGSRNCARSIIRKAFLALRTLVQYCNIRF